MECHHELDFWAGLGGESTPTGAASSSEKELYTVNTLGESLTKTDRNGNVHTFSYDVVGRMTGDAVTTLGSGVNGAVRRLETAYDTGGRAYLFTSYDASSSGSIVNQVQREFNGLGQLITEYQAHSGAVNTGSTPKVQYVYSEMASSANHSRITSMVYPNGRTLTYRYTGLDSSVSRLTDIRDGNDTLEAYSYLGLGTVIRRAQSQAGVELTYLKQGAEGDGEAGDKYAGLDRFGRIRDQRWLKTSDGTARDRFEYGYDRNGNRLYEKNLIDAAFSELYHANGASNGYDKLNQLAEFRRGTLSDANSDGVPDTVTTASRSQVWTFDPLGNWSTVNNDGTAQNRTHNRQNQITSITSLTTPTYDANGNMTGDENGKTLVYDAWNRLVDFKNGGTSLEAYKYDALNRRIEENPGTARALFYSAEWQVIEERTSGVARVSMVWSPVYIDALIVRDRDSDTNGSLEERLYVAHDANWNVSSILNTSATVQERFVYDPFGTPSFKDASYGARGSTNFGWAVLHQGGRWNSVSLLSHHRYRDFTHSLGRWGRNDPMLYQTGHTNLVQGLGSSPINFTDPYGLKECSFAWYDGGDKSSGKTFKCIGEQVECHARRDVRGRKPGFLDPGRGGIPGISDEMLKLGCKCLSTLIIIDHGGCIPVPRGSGQQSIGDDWIGGIMIGDLCSILCPGATVILYGCAAATPGGRPGGTDTEKEGIMDRLIRDCKKIGKVTGCMENVKYLRHEWKGVVTKCTAECPGGWTSIDRPRMRLPDDTWVPDPRWQR